MTLVYQIWVGKKLLIIIAQPVSRYKASEHPYMRLNIIPISSSSLAHTDIGGPINLSSLPGAKYVADFLDDETKMSCVHFLVEKSQLKDALMVYRALAENEHGRRMFRVRLHPEGENASTEARPSSLQNGIQLE